MSAFLDELKRLDATAAQEHQEPYAGPCPQCRVEWELQSMLFDHRAQIIALLEACERYSIYTDAFKGQAVIDAYRALNDCAAKSEG